MNAFTHQERYDRAHLAIKLVEEPESERESIRVRTMATPALSTFSSSDRMKVQRHIYHASGIRRRSSACLFVIPKSYERVLTQKSVISAISLR